MKLKLLILTISSSFLLSACVSMLAQGLENNYDSGDSPNTMACGDMKQPTCRDGLEGKRYCRCD